MNSVVKILEDVSEDLHRLTKEELIEEVQKRQNEYLFLKEKLKQTESFIYDNSDEKQSQVRPIGYRAFGPDKPQTQNIHLEKETPLPSTQLPGFHVAQKPQQRNRNIFNNHPVKQQMLVIPEVTAYNPQVTTHQTHLPPPTTFKNRVFAPASYCSKMHLLHLFKNVSSGKCNRCSGKLSGLQWGCVGCKHFECVQCKPYPRFHCPYNDLLRPTGSLGLDLNGMQCGICESQMKSNGMSCASCNYNLCQKCLQ